MRSIINKISRAVQVVLLAPIKLPGKALNILKYVAVGLGVIESVMDSGKQESGSEIGNQEAEIRGQEMRTGEQESGIGDQEAGIRDQKDGEESKVIIGCIDGDEQAEGNGERKEVGDETTE
ncbi:hypothetical protein GCM10011418_15610 [Sphingobacterium alkalisoli]|uniref:hypothetical protein n=1 Tax=Sphingobacterium alkalisoli TaxID=1874115 RepID=UPI00145F895A|nr:hypothetical protein [Sphingobacterium alkalisoli]GGH14577.1 hypothetical protein GCM10011418_15610 [Sphingobacterium alkalisoli]